MVEATKKNIEHQKGAERDVETFVLDAKKIDTHLLRKDTVIVTE
jgi:hypothetical protein